MKIFVLKPIQVESQNVLWRNTTYQKSVIVRSESELLARALVADIMQSIHAVKTDSFDSPWLDESYVLCEIYQGDLYTIEGIPEILHPENIPEA